MVDLQQGGARNRDRFFGLIPERMNIMITL
jgi:hypothetical protein